MRRSILQILTALTLVGCTAQRPLATSEEGAKKTGETAAATETYYVIRGKHVPFYTFGPAQATGPDRGLEEGEFVRLVKRESGFSKVQLEDGQEGYVPNDFLKEGPKENPFYFTGLGLPTDLPPTRAQMQEFVPPTFIDDNAPLPSVGPNATPAPLIHFR